METRGRPTKYNEERISNAGEYLTAWKDLKEFIPTQAGLADYIKVSLSCVEKWGRDEGKQDFLRVLDAIERIQKRILINNGLANVFNPQITKLILSASHGMNDRLDVVSSDGSMSPKNFNDFYAPEEEE